jgi:hypothetical protein
MSKKDMESEEATATPVQFLGASEHRADDSE